MFFEAAIQPMSGNQKFFLVTPKVKIAVSKQNFVFKATKIRNKLICNALERNESANCGLIIPGSVRNSDFEALLG